MSSLLGVDRDFAYCRSRKGGVNVGARCMPGRRERGYEAAATACTGGPTQGLGAYRARAKRTENMRLMSVTLEVSKLSGWLNADAYCRVKGRGRAMQGGERCEPGGGRAWGVVAAHKRHACGWPDSMPGGQGTRGAHVEHDAHVRDAGGVEAQRLVEHRRVLPSRREGMRCGGERYEPGGGRAWGGGGTQEACTWMARLKAWGPKGHARSARRTSAAWS